MKRLVFETGYWGPSLQFAGVIELLPYLTVTRFADGDVYISVGWIFWYANLELRTVKAP